MPYKVTIYPPPLKGRLHCWVVSDGHYSKQGFSEDMKAAERDALAWVNIREEDQRRWEDAQAQIKEFTVLATYYAQRSFEHSCAEEDLAV